MGLELIVKDLLTQFTQLEHLDRTQAQSQQADRFLLSILRISNHLITEYRLDEILNSIPRREISFPDERKLNLVERFHKLSRYITLCPYLLRYARRFPVFRNIQVRCIEAYPKIPKGFRNTAAETLPRCLLEQDLHHRTPAHEETTIRIEQRLGETLAEIQADLWNKSLLSRRIHAEIQLLFHYERNPQAQLRPRVICASKNTCYLCNVFLSLHDQFHTPKTHGKLYPQWTLPDLAALPLSPQRLQELGNLYRRFHEFIERKIFSCLGTVKLVQTYDNESRILNIRSLTASEASIMEDSNESEHDDARGSSGELNQDRLASVKPSPSLSSSQCTFTELQPVQAIGPLKHRSSRSISSSSPPVQRSIGGWKSSQASCPSSTAQNRAQRSMFLILEAEKACSSVAHSASSELSEPKHLVPGHPVSVFISTFSRPTRFHIPCIHVELTYEYALSMISTDSVELQESNMLNGNGGVQVRAMWLITDKAKTMMGQPGEVDLAGDWTSKRLDGASFGSAGLLLRKGKDVLQLSIESKGFVTAR